MRQHSSVLTVKFYIKNSVISEISMSQSYFYQWGLQSSPPLWAPTDCQCRRHIRGLIPRFLVWAMQQKRKLVLTKHETRFVVELFC